MNTAAQKPIIGITSGEIQNKDQPWSPVTFGQSRTYVEAIIQAGGVPLLLPLTTDETLLAAYADLLDGICFAGGNDIHPRRYGQQAGAETNDYSELRDTTEFFLMRRILAGKKPILAICRGMQLLNSYLGGTLYQDIVTDLPGSLDHAKSSKLKTLVDVSHKLRIAPDSQLANFLSVTTIGANAHHHQAINKMGEGITAVAWAEDDVIEAIELRDYPFAVGIQAHPESLIGVEPRWRNLFEAFIKACV